MKSDRVNDNAKVHLTSLNRFRKMNDSVIICVLYYKIRDYTKFTRRSEQIKAIMIFFYGLRATSLTVS